MIYTFRKEIGKWKLILWPVLISLAASSLVMIRRSSQTATVASVNGEAITYKSFATRMKALQEQINQLRGYARSSGIPVETFLQLYGLGDPTNAALEGAVHEKLVGSVLKPLWVSLHEDVVSTELLKMLPADFVDATGRVNQQAYRKHLQHQHMHIAEFESRKEEEMCQNLFNDFVGFAAYPDRASRQAAMEEKLAKKSFSVIKVSFGDIRSSLKDDANNEEKEAYYENNKENYRVPEKRDFSYWVVSPSVAERKVDVSDRVIERFYEKNKTTLYRISPQVKVRHIFIKEGEDAQKLARELHDKISASPSSFADLAKKHSHDKETAKNGGLRDFFSRGTFDKDFEKAAFRLKKPGDLSPVVKTEAGYEVIQLVERIAASEKPLSEVRSEVEKAVRGKRALEWLRSHLERIRKDAVANQEVVREITHAADSHKTIKHATQSQANSYSIEGLVVENGFALRGEGSYGFFMHEDTYVLVQLNNKAGSFIPAFKEVSKQVSADFIDEKAQMRVNEIAATIRKQIVDGGSPADVARAHRATHTQSDALSISETSQAPFRGVSGLLRKAFMLTSTSQVLSHNAEKDCYLVQLVGIDQKTAEEAADAVDDVAHINAELDAQSQSVSRAFIASLRRSAKIDLNEKMLTVRPNPVA